MNDGRMASAAEQMTSGGRRVAAHHGEWERHLVPQERQRRDRQATAEVVAVQQLVVVCREEVPYEHPQRGGEVGPGWDCCTLSQRISGDRGGVGG